MYIVLGARVKNESAVNKLLEHGIDHKVYEAEKGLKNYSEKIIPEYIGYDNFFNLQFYKDKKIQKVINFRDQQNWLRIENEIAIDKDLPQKMNTDTMDFYCYKSVQHTLAEDLDIPVLETESDKMIVKLDTGYSGGDGFKVVKRSNYTPKANEYTQRYIDIEYTIAVQAYADLDAIMHPFCFHRMDYIDNNPTYCQVPYFGKETEQLTKYLEKLKTKIEIRDRLIFWQFVKERNGNLYNLDFNCRPAGGFETGTYDTLIGDCNILDCYLGKTDVPEAITFDKQVQITYKYKQQFGYSPIDKEVIKVDKQLHEVKKI